MRDDTLYVKASHRRVELILGFAAENYSKCAQSVYWVSSKHIPIVSYLRIDKMLHDMHKRQVNLNSKLTTRI